MGTEAAAAVWERCIVTYRVCSYYCMELCFEKLFCLVGLLVSNGSYNKDSLIYPQLLMASLFNTQHPKRSSPWQRGSDPTVGVVEQDEGTESQH